MPDRRRHPKHSRIRAKRELAGAASALLLRACVLLDKPARLSRKAYALNARGVSVSVDDPSAARFCLAGALLRAEHLMHGTPMPTRTDPGPNVNDLFQPILPTDAPRRVSLALQLLAVSAGFSLRELGARIHYLNPEDDEIAPSALHRPLLLTSHPRARFRDCERALTTALGISAWISADESRLDASLLDWTVGSC